MMTIEGDHLSSILRRLPLRPTEPVARGELVWSEDRSTVLDSTPITSVPAAVEAVAAPEPVNAPPSDEDVVSAEIERLRSEALEHLDAELRARRAELEQTLLRDRATAQERIATAEQLQQEALGRRHLEMERWSEQWAAEQHRLLAEKIEAALAAELGDVRVRYQHAESRILRQIEARRHAEAERLEAWRASERERIEAELAAEQEQFHERLLEELKAFESQLVERQREQEARIASWWEDAGRLVRQRVATILDEALGSAT
jgi:hypothetical protein